MPLVKLKTSSSLPGEKQEEALSALSRIVSETLGKPEQYVMVTGEEGSIVMGGVSGPAALVDIRSIGGLTGEANRELSAKICAFLEKELDIPPGRVYLNFTDISAPNWGYNGSTFG